MMADDCRGAMIVSATFALCCPISSTYFVGLTKEPSEGISQMYKPRVCSLVQSIKIVSPFASTDPVYYRSLWFFRASFFVSFYAFSRKVSFGVLI